MLISLEVISIPVLCKLLSTGGMKAVKQGS